ncbi:MAG TPA: SDR family NAD(P)-dependent oxidoreductase [Gemmatales bacterium]|nr:SDR family NAD(P)-dependent oxidoreductase [Gemmatales bacterium]HMP60174.1 SDR family NAD(P)-dependent oxidoreductase [Gemmatales bacterium]
MSQNYANQVVLITGAASGIGRQLSLEFVRRGARIAAIDLAREPLEVLMKDLAAAAGTTQPPGAWALGDVTRLEQMHAAVRKLEAELGPIDVVVANAGIGMDNPVIGFSAAVFEKQVAVNLVGIANTLEPVLPGMIERRRGHVVGIVSLASYRGLPLMAGYCASKAGAASLMDALRVELLPHNIDCTSICPGWIKTNLTKNIDVPMPGMLTVEEAVAIMMRAIERKKRYIAFPFKTRFLLLLNRVLPTRVGDWLVLRVMGKAIEKKAAEAKAAAQTPPPQAKAG